MSKLTLQQIAPYVAAELKGEYTLSDVINLTARQKDEIREVTLTADNLPFFLKYCTPILYNPIHLTTEINGVCHIDEICGLYGCNEVVATIDKDNETINLYIEGEETQIDIIDFNDFSKTTYGVIQYMIQNHFAIGLDPSQYIDKFNFTK